MTLPWGAEPGSTACFSFTAAGWKRSDMTEVLVQGTKGVKRRRTLEPYLLKVQEVLRREPLDPTRSRRLSIDGVALSIEPWVIASVEPQGGAPDGNTDRAELLGQSLALWLKTALD